MKKLLFLFLAFGFLSASAQTADLDSAKLQAGKDGKDILIVFSGSDWCIPCIRLEKEVFTKAPFQDFAKSSLIVMHADFPRLKKHQLTKEQQKKNEELAAQYNKQGSFPYTVLLDAQGNVLKGWEGTTIGSSESFVSQLKSFHHDR